MGLLIEIILKCLVKRNVITLQETTNTICSIELGLDSVGKENFKNNDLHNMKIQTHWE